MDDQDHKDRDARPRTDVTTTRGVAKRTRGTIQKFRDGHGRAYWRARITLADGKRVYLARHFTSEVLAREYADEQASAAVQSRLTLADGCTGIRTSKETCDEYFERLADVRAAQGLRAISDDRYRWYRWVSPRIGRRPVVDVTRDEIEDVRDDLDVAVTQRNTLGLAEGISGKTAQEIWSVVRTTFKATVSHRNRKLRVRTDDPSFGHQPPLKSPKPIKTFIYPCEFLQLICCEDIPWEWRCAYTIAIYLYARPEELEAVRWLDVDFHACTVAITKVYSHRLKRVIDIPKTSSALRTIPIPKPLMPLLRVLHGQRAADEDLLLPILKAVGDTGRAKLFRSHLERAGVTRSRLFEKTLTVLPVIFRSCRDTGITWLALDKVHIETMRRRAGHKHVATTLEYVKQAEDLDDALGKPFPELPADFIGRLSRV